uniref:hypothetical protein n=1 Tax=uncultured Sphingomonas sp. TaxID=158754 RepID=UPI0035CC3D55
MDDDIAAFEQDLGKDVAILRTTPPDTSIEPGLAARITVHLVMRTAHLRQTIEHGIDGITNEIESLFTNPMRLGAMMGIDSPMLASTVTDLAAALRDNGGGRLITTNASHPRPLARVRIWGPASSLTSSRYAKATHSIRFRWTCSTG